MITISRFHASHAFAVARIEPMPAINMQKLISDCAANGDPFAEFEIGLAFDYGSGVEQDFGAASQWYERAALQGHQAAEANLLLQHVLGQVARRRPEDVLDRLLECAESGDREAQNNVGLCYQFGYGAAQDYCEAAKWFRRAAEAGFATAQFNLGGFYFEGHGVPKDLKIAAEWYTRAAEQREELALLKLGQMYQKGLGVTEHLSRAFLLYLIAYRRGSTRAANHLGFMFKKGLGTKRDDSTAYQLYMESVSGPDTPEIAENLTYRGTAYFWLGSMRENGEGVQRDLRAAKRFYSRGAACGQRDCVQALARLGTRKLQACRGKL